MNPEDGTDPVVEEWANQLLSCLTTSVSEESLERARQIFVGESASCELARRQAVLAAEAGVNTLIAGEPGSGKELIARIIHEFSARGRSGGAFVSCNAAAVPMELFDTLFFGNEEGHPSVGSPATPGFLREADGGYLFIDEIGDLAPILQTRLLGVLETGTIRPLGHPGEVGVDVLLLAGTDRDLKQASSVEAPTFRPELYHRIRKLLIRTPALRSHLVDVPAIARCLWARIPEADGRPLPEHVLRKLQRHCWPENVRELETFLLDLALVSDESGFERLADLYLIQGDLGGGGDRSRPERQSVDLTALIDVLAEASHETWREKEQAAGCSYGQMRIDDGRVRTSPDLLPFASLSETQKANSRDEARAIVQALLDSGFVIRKVETP